MREFIARIHHEEDGMFWAEVLDLPGCFASGESLDELREALEEAISLYLRDEPGSGPIRGDRQQPEIDVGSVEVSEIRVKVPA